MEIVPRRGLTPVPEPAPPRPARRLAPAQLTLALVALAALAVHAGARNAAREADLRRLLASAASVGLDPAALADAERRARREIDAADRRVAMAAAMLDRELLAFEPAAEASYARLGAARELAREALLLQPANHEAAMIVGATTSLERSRRRDTRLFSLSPEWERPLAAALELAPGAARPRHLLAAAYLEVWPALSPAKRELASGLLRDAFRDPSAFQRLFGSWVEIAGSLDAAAELLPDESKSYRQLADTARARRDAAGYARMTERWRGALFAELEREIARVESARAGGGPVPLDRFAEALGAAPLDDEFAPLVERALALRPAGAARPAEARSAESWFQWAAPLCLVRDCPLSGAALARLASLAGGFLEPEQAAFAALAAGDTARADLLERRTEAVWSEPWAPYLTFKALRLVDAGDLAGARAALAATHRAFRVRSAWRRLAAATALSTSSIPSGLPPLARDAWEPTDWWFERGTARLDLVASRTATTLELDPATALTEGALIELVWDGRRLAPLPVPARARDAPPLRVPLSSSALEAATAGPHLLEVRVLWGDLRPAMRVRLG